MNRVRHEVLHAALLLALVYVVATGSALFRPAHSTVATFWPAAGLATILVLGARREHWGRYVVGVALVTGLANATAGRPLLLSGLFGVSNALEALVVAAVLCRRHQRPSLQTPEDFLRLLQACALGALTISVGAGLSIALVGGDGLAAARTVAPSHLAASLTIVPLALVVRPALRPLLTRELLAQAGWLAVAILVVFVPSQGLAFSFLPLPLLMWAALRLDPFVTAVEVGVLGVLTTWLTARGSGPFASQIAFGGGHPDGMVTGMQVQVYLVAAAVMALTAALAAAQRAQLLRGLTRERAVTATMLDSTIAMIIVTDVNGVIRRVNPATRTLTGFAEESLLGRRIWETPVIPVERRDLVEGMFGDAAGTAIPGSREADVMTASGERRRVIWNNVVNEADPDEAFAIFTAIDVTAERRSAGILHHLLEAPMATALVALDQHGRVSLFNRGAQEMLGHEPEHVLGTPIGDLVGTDQPAQYLDGAFERVNALRSFRGHDEAPDTILDLAETDDWIWWTASGHALTVSTTITVVTDTRGEPLGYLCVGRDVTEERHAQERLVSALDKERAAVERLRRLDEAKDDFVSTVSHELRTPTTSIVGYCEMLLDGSVDEPTPGQLPMLEAIARNGHRLIAVASDLLVLAELESDEDASLELLPVDLARIVTHAEEALRPLITQRDLSVDFAVDARTVRIFGDAAHLDRLLMNLLSNAVKFTRDGGRITCCLRTEGSAAVIEVSDTGIGIPEAEQGELFTKFFRSSNAQEQAIQGTGLGLSIIARIVDAHGGRVSVRSRPGSGTTFTVTLPLADARQVSLSA